MLAAEWQHRRLFRGIVVGVQLVCAARHRTPHHDDGRKRE